MKAELRVYFSHRDLDTAAYGASIALKHILEDPSSISGLLPIIQKAMANQGETDFVDEDLLGNDVVGVMLFRCGPPESTFVEYVPLNKTELAKYSNEDVYFKAALFYHSYVKGKHGEGDYIVNLRYSNGDYGLTVPCGDYCKPEASENKEDADAEDK